MKEYKIFEVLIILVTFPKIWYIKIHSLWMTIVIYEPLICEINKLKFFSKIFLKY